MFSEKSTEEKDSYRQDMKAKGGCFELTAIPNFDKEEEVKTIFLKKCDRETYSAVKKLNQSDVLKGMECMVRSLYVGGDALEEVLTFEGLRSMIDGLYEMLSVKSGSIKKN